jgi:hypothetical protein
MQNIKVKNIKVKNGTYTQLRHAHDCVEGTVYYATFTYNNGWHDTESRIVTVNSNNEVVAWQS